MQSNSCYDIVIVGAGIVGATLACALAQTTALRIALLDAQPAIPTWTPEQYDHRVSALSLASQQLFSNLGIWQAIAKKRISAFTNMTVWDENSTGRIEFNSAELGEPLLGYMVENSAIAASLFAQLQQDKRVDIFLACQLLSLNESAEQIEIITSEQTFTTKLLIAADGANSWVRQQAHIETSSRVDNHTAIVATVTTELPHQHTAWQRFLHDGPLAFLPLNSEQLCSIVWSMPEEKALTLLRATQEEFNAQLGSAFENHLGRVLKTEKRFSFPLRRHLTKNYVKPRIALVGDAAHTIHPLAGQGVNLGLLDVVALTEVIHEALRKKRDFSSLPTLRKYERQRKGDNALMFTAMETLKNLFGSDNTNTQSLRGRGLKLVDQLPWLKNMFIAHAVGRDSSVIARRELK